jgi:SSS family solute:Na+ symporter
MVFAGYLKIILPLIVVIPGIVAFSLAADIGKPDEAYPWLLNRFVPAGIKGFVFAALIAAIVSSLSAIINSTATIFTMDIYKSYILPSASESRLVLTGRVAGIAATLVAASVAPSLGRIDQAFQFIQEYTGMVSPGITAIFLLGLFWKKTTSKAALWGILVSILASVGLKYGFPDMPFLDQMVLAFLAVAVFMVLFSLLEGKMANNPKGLVFEAGLFRTGKMFNITATLVMVILLVLYIVFW